MNIRTTVGKPSLWIIIPCYNEEAVLPLTIPLFKEELSLLKTKDKIADDSRILLVNDGFNDATGEMIWKYAAEDPSIIGISQSRNRGHQNALLAGLIQVLL